MSREQFEAWGRSDVDLRITLEIETYAAIAWMAWQAATASSTKPIGEVKIYSASPSDMSPPVDDASFCVDFVLASDYAALQAERDQLAAECAALKSLNEDRRVFIMNGVQLGYIKVPTVETDPALETIRIAVSPQEQTPATDRFLAEQRAQARIEGVNFAAARVAAAFNHGFIDKPTLEVYDVVKAVLGAKEELATAPEDGLSGEYAEQALNDWSAKLRNEVKV